ncbi:SDR family NAD(P)-dependent oxidoreductase [Actinocorallia sp. API 0066]|uniref:SDR family NAD(P)-dependent oxidoreductase n=1 Tax=Actinocorallia sp. API 0066 TaxID=2896846 RepID=UPI001E47C9C9|nr:SDR family NAD(P)-dependent oxidoreductase [Actinocorallia sp. API 0066]MCD0451682.1 SDR family NAD(P)-dependent oxidoreductase [Actinocorallia sp. API 0066]
MKTAVITGGTDGIGRGLADAYLGKGYEVLIVGRNTDKGKRFLDEAARAGAGSRAHFREADLGLVTENEKLIEEIATAFPAVDLLVLGARYHRSAWTPTAEGYESTFALFYLSRFLLSHGLADRLERAEHPVVLNFGASGQAGPVRWEDPQLVRGYHGVGAMGHCGRLNDLLAVSFTDLRPDSEIRYVVNHPGVVATSFAGEYDPMTAAHVAEMRATAKPVARSVAQILPYLEPSRANGRLTAVLEGRRVPVDTGLFDSAEAARLHRMTEALLGRHA